MQRMFLLAALAVIAMLGGCAARDPNLVVKGVNEFGRTPGDYTLRVNLYDLDAKGLPRLAAADDASLRGFAARSLAARGYVLKASGPAKYDIAVHLLCGNMRSASLGLVTEDLSVPAEAAGPGFSPQVHYWLPNAEPAQTGDEAQGRHGAVSSRQAANDPRGSVKSLPGGAGRAAPDACQGRVLVVLTPATGGPLREVYVARAATDDCNAVDGACPAKACRSALEQSLVDLLEHRF